MRNLFIVDLEGKIITPIEEQIITHPQVGAIILFERNFQNKTQIKQLTDSIRALRPDIFIAVDQEGGAISRFKRQGFLLAPAAQTYGLAYDHHAESGTYLAKLYGDQVARELIDCGVDLNFAPVLDLDDPKSTIIGQLGRAFHAQPEAVSVLAGAFIEGMHEAGMPSVGKHFPGHGRIPGDSHLTLPRQEASIEELRNLDLKPFSILIQQGQLDAVMAAHVVYPAVDAENAAGFSSAWLKTILRQELNFKGLVFSDCLSMKGAEIGDMRTRAHKALDAGCDCLILCNEPRESLLAFLNANRFEQNDDSMQRMDQFKQRMRRFKLEGSHVIGVEETIKLGF